MSYIPQSSSDLAAWVSAIGTCTGLIFVIASLYLTRGQLRRQADTLRSQVFSQIADDWTRLYPIRNAVIGGAVWDGHANKKLRTLQELEDAYPTYDLFFKDPNNERQEIRQLCNFYEKLGVAVHKEFLEAELVFVLVTIDTKSGDIKARLAPYIQYLRGGAPKDRNRTPYRGEIISRGNICVL
jgi:hypothetical protein